MDIREANALASRLMNEHGLFDKGWTFEFDRSIKRMGLCSYRRKVISVSKPLAEVNSEETVRDTILHEIAHVLAGAIAGHGCVWKLLAKSIGAIPEACCKLANIVQVETAWQGTCLDCQVTVSRLRAPMLGRTYRHNPCYGKANSGKVAWSYKGKRI